MSIDVPFYEANILFTKPYAVLNLPVELSSYLNFGTSNRIKLRGINLESLATSAQLSDGSMLDGGLDGGDDPEHPVAGPALRVGPQPVQPGLPHHRRLCGHDAQLGAVGAVLGQARSQTGTTAEMENHVYNSSLS